jgi:hypothetical protein
MNRAGSPEPDFTKKPKPMRRLQFDHLTDDVQKPKTNRSLQFTDDEPPPAKQQPPPAKQQPSPAKQQPPPAKQQPSPQKQVQPPQPTKPKGKRKLPQRQSEITKDHPIHDVVEKMPSIQDDKEFLKRIDEFLRREKQDFREGAGITLKQLTWFMNKYFVSKELFNLGRDRIFKFVVKEHPEVGLSRRQVNRILQSFELVQVMNPKKKTTDIKKQIQKRPMALVELDLVDMSNQASKGYTWLMNCIDTFSKYAWSIPLKDKSEATVIQGFKKMLAKMKENAGVLPSTILSDNGSEFINSGMQKVFKDNNIRHILTNAGKASHAKSVERFNLYTRHAVTRYKSSKGVVGYYTPKIVPSYES